MTLKNNTEIMEKFFQQGIFGNKKTKGFTLIELMVTVAIMGILAGVVLVSLSRSRAEQDVKLAAREFSSVLRTAQSNALNGKFTTLTNIPCQFRVRYISETQYSLSYRTLNAGSCTGGTTIIQSLTLPNGVEFSNSWSNNEGEAGIVFTLPTGSGAAGNISSVTITKASSSQTVCIPKQSTPGSDFSC